MLQIIFTLLFFIVYFFLNFCIFIYVVLRKNTTTNLAKFSLISVLNNLTIIIHPYYNLYNIRIEWRLKRASNRSLLKYRSNLNTPRQASAALVGKYTSNAKSQFAICAGPPNSDRLPSTHYSVRSDNSYTVETRLSE